MKKLLLSFYCSLLLSFSIVAQPTYQPTAANLQSREWFENAKFGLFIHWGLFSLLGDGEWVLNNRNIPFENYKLLEKSFNPIDFNADSWVKTAKDAGMKYITLVTRHHDGFSLWNTKYSDFNVMHTPYGKDIVKQIADACHKQHMKLFLYYSLLDWGRTDYSYWTGRTGKGTGRTIQGNWLDYIQFMKNQLKELLTNYGEISGIWFDGYWDQMPEESSARKDQDVKVDWHMREIYDWIHQLQPQCMVGNNHHMTPIPGEDFQMFEQDVPGENTHGLSFQKTSHLPLETCATMNNNWGYNIKDESYKSFSDLIHLLVKSAGAGANLLLNVGPLPNGEIQNGFRTRLDSMGRWLQSNGESIYDTKGGYLPQQKWGVLTQKPGSLFIHILKDSVRSIQLPDFPYKKITKAYLLSDKSPISVQLQNKTAVLKIPQFKSLEPDKIVVLEVE